MYQKAFEEHKKILKLKWNLSLESERDSIQAWLKAKKPRVLERPSQSPDLKQALHARKPSVISALKGFCPLESTFLTIMSTKLFVDAKRRVSFHRFASSKGGKVGYEALGCLMFFFKENMRPFYPLKDKIQLQFLLFYHQLNHICYRDKVEISS